MQEDEAAGRRDGLAIAGVELGGTKCVCILANPAGTILEQATVATAQPAETIAAIRDVLDRWQRERRFAALGIASFGPLDLDRGSAAYGRITTTPKPGWRDTAIVAGISHGLDVPLGFDTDVNGAALAERRWGAARGLEDFAYVTVGTGVGVGLIVHGRATRGLGHCEIGHMRVARLAGDAWPGACGYHGGCVEGLASGTAIAARLGDVPVATLPPDHPVWESVADALAQMVQVLVLAAGCRRVLVGGGVAAGHPHVLPRIEARLRELIAGYVALPAPDPAEPYVRAPGLGASAGPLGPIALALDALGAR